MAAQCNAPLRSGKQTMMGEVKNIEKSLVLIFYWHNVVGSNTYSKKHKNGREDSKNRRATDALAIVYNGKI